MKNKRIHLKFYIILSVLFMIHQVTFAKPFSDRIADSIPQFVLPNSYLYGMNEWIIGDACSDIAEIGGYNISDAVAAQQMSIFNIKAGQMPIFTYYRWNYFGIGLCNQYLKLIDGKISPITLQQQRAKILFYRALFYFNLVRLFGDIPLYTENDISQVDSSGKITIFNNYMPVIQSDTLHKPRIQTSEIWQRIESDLIEAIPLLPQNSSLDSNQWYKVTKGAALTLMAKSKLYQKQWDAALDYSLQIINSGEYGLEENFANVFTIKKHGKESIFELEQYPSAYVYFPDAPNVAGYYWASFNHNVYNNLRHVLIDSKSNGSKPNGYYGWGFNCPTKRYVESFIAGDPRKIYTIFNPGDSIIWNIESDTTWAIMDTTSSLYNDPNGGTSPTGYNLKKYFVTGSEAINSGVSSDIVNTTNILPHSGGYKNIRIFRYADVILMAAEAGYNLGKTDSAIYFLNLIRKRARNSGNTGFPKDISTITLDSIYNERKWEFGGEGYRLFDLFRTRKAYEAINGNYNSSNGTNVYFDTTKNYLFPIPIQDIVMSKGILTQNPGYESPDMVNNIAVSKPFKNWIFKVDTTVAATHFFTYTSREKIDTMNSHFDLDNTLQLGIIPRFTFQNKSKYTTFLGHIDNPDVNGDYATQIYSYSFQYFQNTKIDKYPFIDTIVVSATNYKDTVWTSFTITLEPKINTLVEQSQNSKGLTIFPNPSGNKIVVKIDPQPESSLYYKIYSMAGVLMLSGEINTQSTQIDISNIPSGLYSFTIPAIQKSIKFSKIND
jgi:starch-binding outer membrane protein, SusD/RagB family